MRRGRRGEAGLRARPQAWCIAGHGDAQFEAPNTGQHGSRPAQGQGPSGPRFVHLKVHSAYSLLEGALHIGSLAKLAGALRMPAVGLTDTNNMFGVLEFSDKLAAAGIQPIAGCALQTDFGDSQGAAQVRLGPPDAGAKPAGALALLCRNEAGYANLMKLGSACHLKPAD